MSTFPGRFRVDCQPSATSGASTVTEWYADGETADLRAVELGRLHGGRAVSWWWPWDYAETPGEEATRIVRDGLYARVTWLREVA